MDRNGYFELENKSDGTYLIIHEPEGQGKPATLEQLVKYLDAKHVDYPNVALLKTAMEQTPQTESFRVSRTQVIPFTGWCDYVILPGAVMAQMIMYAPTKGMPDVTFDEVASDIKKLGICYGVNVDLLRAILNSKRYNEAFVFAKYKAPRDGKDAVLTYNFNPEYDATPKINDNGTVDFHQLDVINHVTAGDVVATIEKEDPGDAGINILGQEVKPKKVYKKSFKYARNMHVSEDGCKLITDVTGHVMLEGDKVFVSDEYEVKADVDTSTGDIEFNGNVRVRGAVRSGFKIRATGNVVVDGVVEAAEIVAGGNIILARGISGQSKGSLHADGNIVTTFIESANVVCHGKMEVDTILHSNVTIRDSLEAHGKSGSLIGGMIRVGALIVAKEIGSPMGTKTIITVGSDPEELERVKELKAKVAKLTDEKNKLTQLVEVLRKRKEIEGSLDEEKTTMLMNATKNMILMGQSLATETELYEKSQAEIHEASDARIKIERSIFPGVKLEFGRDAIFIRDRSDHCQYVKRGADITMVPL